MRGVKVEEKILLERFKRILLQYGEDISEVAYKELDIRDKPPVTTLRNNFGSWNLAKEAALGKDMQIRARHLVAQNNQLFSKLDLERDKSRVFVENCLAAIEKLDIKPVPVPKPETVKDNLEFKAIRSDAHVGEKTDETHVQMLARYNVDLYKKRLARWLEKIILFREQDKNSLGLNKLTAFFLGDQVGGEAIYQGQQFYLDLALVDQLFTSVEEESNVFLTLASVFPEIEIFCVPGNHGRPGQKGANHYRTNFDYIFYRSLKSALRHQPNVKVYVSESPMMLIQEGEYKVIMNHGDNVKSWAGIPFYGLERQFQRLHSLFGTVVDIELVAHHHQPLNICDRIIMNGSFPGGSDMSINVMSLSNIPSQKIFYFHHYYGINRESNLHLARPTKLEPDGNNIYTSYS